MAFRTLEELRIELLARLGMGAMGASGGANRNKIDSMLRNGQVQLYRQADWRHLTDYQDLTLGVSQNLLDYPSEGVMGSSGCRRDQRVIRIERYFAGEWTKLTEGITTAMWSTMETLSYPTRYERYRQIMVYPKANQVYTVRVWFLQDLGRFTQDDDVATIDDELILLHALANGKGDYRHPDAATYQGQLNTLLASLRGQSFSHNGVYRRNDPPAPLPRPAVVGRDV